MSGAGLGCISRSTVELELRAGHLRLVHAPWLDLRRQITVLVHREKYLDANLQRFLLDCGVKLPAKL
jgi:DNA-binding transcriptional LysR family regulator